MGIRAVHVLVPLLIVAVSGCSLLKRKKKPPTFDESPPPSSLVLEPPAVNRGDLTRFADEGLLHGQGDVVRQVAFARTAPDEAGTSVGIINANTPVLKWSVRRGSTLVTFDREGFAGKKFAGWISDISFTPPAPAKTGVAGAKRPPDNTAAVAGTGAPRTGSCQMTLRSASFTPSPSLSSSCTFNEKVRSGSPATLNFPCAGGTASARFSTQTFTGSADPKSVQISNSTIFQFKACNVRSVQTISGAPPLLSYTYSESIVSGDCNGVTTCTASGSIAATLSP